MSPQQMRTIGRRLYWEAVERGHEQVVDELVADDFIDSSPDIRPGSIREGKDGLLRYIRALHEALEDLHVRIHELLVDGDTLIARVTFEGAHRGEMLGVPPTGRWIAWDTIDILRVREGRIRERVGVSDRLGLLSQLGVFGASDIGSRTDGEELQSPLL